MNHPSLLSRGQRSCWMALLICSRGILEEADCFYYGTQHACTRSRWIRSCVTALRGFYCCAVPFTTSAKEILSPVERSMLAKKVQWSWSSLETAGEEPLLSG